MESITQRVFRLAQERDIKQVDIATACKLSPTTVISWYHRDVAIPAIVIMPICRLLEVSPELILTDVDEHYPSIAAQLAENEEEQKLLDAFRSCSDEGRIVVCAAAIMEARRNEGK